MKKIYFFILFGLLIGVSGCSNDDPGAPQVALTPEQQVLENCRLVQDAADQFAAGNNQVFPADNTDLTAGGLTLIDFLPGGHLLENPYTGERTSPVNGGANSPGDVGYIGFRCDLEVTSYAITGVQEVLGDRSVMIRNKCNGEVVELTGDYTPTLDDIVLENMFIVQAATVAYADGNDGVYPPDRTTPNLAGNTLIDLLPNGEFLVNPWTGEQTEPSGGCFDRTGEISYTQLEEWDYDLDRYAQVGFCTTGQGADDYLMLTNIQKSIHEREREVIENSLLVRLAVESFAADNNGEYPWTTADETPAGDTFIDYLPDSRLLVNPFTGARTEPVVGLAAAQGSTGYLASDRNGDGLCDGYLIDGLGVSVCTKPVIQVVHPPE